MTSELFVLRGGDNDLYFFRDRPDVRRCPTCGTLLAKWAEDLSRVVLPHAPKLDVSVSYDGVLVFSRRALNIVSSFRLRGLDVRPLLTGDFAAIRPTRVVPFDAQRRRTRLLKQCVTCGQFGEVAGATPAPLVVGTTIAPDEFVRTDVEFGSWDEKAPLVICGAAAAAALRGGRLRGLEFKSVVAP